MTNTRSLGHHAHQTRCPPPRGASAPTCPAHSHTEHARLYLLCHQALFIRMLRPTASSSRPFLFSRTCRANNICRDPTTGMGVCGMGPTFCAPGNCTSECNAKSECDPGWGAQWSQATKCPLNVCCSKFGFCGTTPDFCDGKTVPSPNCPGGKSADQKTIGYYEGWNLDRSCGREFKLALDIFTKPTANEFGRHGAGGHPTRVLHAHQLCLCPREPNYIPHRGYGPEYRCAVRPGYRSKEEGHKSQSLDWYVSRP